MSSSSWTGLPLVCYGFGVPGGRKGGRRAFDVDTMQRAEARAYAKVQAAADKAATLSRMADAATSDLYDAISSAAQQGIPHSVIASLSSLSEPRIWQIVNDYQPKKGKGSK